MEVVAISKGGFLLSATENELKEIINSVTGTRPDNVGIGQKIPAIDYASTITKVKSLKNNDQYKYLLQRAETFTEVIEKLKVAVEEAASITV